MEERKKLTFVEEVNKVSGEELAPALANLLASKHTGAIIIHVTQGRMQVMEWRKKLPDK